MLLYYLIEEELYLRRNKHKKFLKFNKNQPWLVPSIVLVRKKQVIFKINVKKSSILFVSNVH